MSKKSGGKILRGERKMNVQVITNVNFIWQGKTYKIGAIIENYSGDLYESLRVVSNQPKTGAAPSTPGHPEKVVEILKTQDDTEILGFFDGTSLSPETIKAKIREVESATVVETKSFESSDVPKEPEVEELKKVKVARGWYEVQDEDGNTISNKKMREAEADIFIKNLNA